MPDSVIGFSPNWYEGQNNAGLGIYIAPGSINGKVYQGGVYYVNVSTKGLLPQPIVTYFWLTVSGQIQQGLSLPSGIYAIAVVVAGNVLTGTGKNVYAVQITQAPGILNITDLRPVTDDKFSFSGDFNGMVSNNEVVTMSGTSGSVAHTPNGSFFLLTKNGVVQNMGIGGDFTLFGPNITLSVAAQAQDLYIAWYTY